MTTLKNTVKLECVIEDKCVVMFCDHDTPLTLIKEALFQFQKHIGQIEDNVRTQLAQQASESEAKQEAQNI